MIIKYNNIPFELMVLPQWVCWKYEERDGKQTKVLKNPYTGQNASTKDPGTWAFFPDAQATASSDPSLGIGFVLTQSDAYVGIDSDECIRPDNSITEEGLQTLADFGQSYHEISPSGKGLKFWIRGTLPTDKSGRRNAKLGVEVYQHSRFFTVTGNCLGDQPKPILDCNDALQTWYAQKFPPDTNSDTYDYEVIVCPISAEEIIAKATSDDPVFAELFGGDWPAKYPSQSEADLALCTRIAYWAGPDPDRIDEVFQASGLCRDKWKDRSDYRKSTIDKAVAYRHSHPQGFYDWAWTPEKDFVDLLNTVDCSGLQPQTVHHSGDYVPFPVELLPRPLRRFIDSVTASIGCDPSFVALPVLATCAAAIGNTRILVAKPDWSVLCILWCAVIGESGTQKSPAFKAAYKPLRKRQSRLLKEFQEATAAYKANGASKDPPPVYERCLVSDTTVEALVPVLRDNWRGVFLARDELAGWIRSFDQYKKKAGGAGDSSHWLSLYNGQSIIVDRKSGEVKVIEVPQPSLCICGGIQPGILNQAIGGEHREDGLLARLLISYPPRRQKRWTDKSVTPSVEAEYDNVISALFALQGKVVDRDLISIPVALSPGARDLVEQHVNTNGAEQFCLTGELAAAWSKLEEVAPRLALVIHCVRFVSGEHVDPLVCDAESMEAAVKLTAWFKNETLRVYHLITESSEERQHRELVVWIAKKGGRVRPRDLLTGRQTTNIDEAERQLAGLVKARYGKWEPSLNTTGPTAREFVLFS